TSAGRTSTFPGRRPTSPRPSPAAPGAAKQPSRPLAPRLHDRRWIARPGGSAMAREVVVRPTGTSWGAVLDGWLATVGVAAILTPIIGVMLTSWYTTRSYASTVPILVAVGLSYLVGGYVAGRMAGYRTSWHGMMVAFFGL